jgi:hypothetical protein
MLRPGSVQFGTVSHNLVDDNQTYDVKRKRAGWLNKTRVGPNWTQQGENMLYTIIGVLVLLWVLGFAMNFGGNVIHALLVIALVVFVVNLISGRRAVWLSTVVVKSPVSKERRE